MLVFSFIQDKLGITGLASRLSEGHANIDIALASVQVYVDSGNAVEA